jgi:hypothetical protein
LRLGDFGYKARCGEQAEKLAASHRSVLFCGLGFNKS